jgi:hypothetical protein
MTPLELGALLVFGFCIGWLFRDWQDWRSRHR